MWYASIVHASEHVGLHTCTHTYAAQNRTLGFSSDAVHVIVWRQDLSSLQAGHFSQAGCLANSQVVPVMAPDTRNSRLSWQCPAFYVGVGDSNIGLRGC